MLTERTTYHTQIRSEFEARLVRLDQQEEEINQLKSQNESIKKKVEKLKQKLLEEKEAREEEKENHRLEVAARERQLTTLK